MKHVIVRRKVSGNIIHIRRNMWGHGIVPSRVCNNFKELRANGFYHPDFTWKMCCKAYRKKMRKMKIAKLSRKKSNKRIKRAR